MRNMQLQGFECAGFRMKSRDGVPRLRVGLRKTLAKRSLLVVSASKRATTTLGDGCCRLDPSLGSDSYGGYLALGCHTWDVVASRNP
jgi:hypothetical protein